MNKQQAHRLMNVAKALRERKNPKLFTMKKFVWGDFVYVDLCEGRRKEMEFCGTPACALGTYAARGDLQKLIKIEYDYDMNGKIDGAAVVYRAGDEEGEQIDFYDDQLHEHFGITSDQAHELFGSSGCGDAKTPIQAARYIEKFVKQHRAAQ